MAWQNNIPNFRAICIRCFTLFHTYLPLLECLSSLSHPVTSQAEISRLLKGVVLVTFIE